MKRLLILLAFFPMMLGAQQWEIIREDNANLENGIINDNEDVIIVGDDNGTAAVMSIDSEGNHELLVYEDLPDTYLQEITELSNGNYFVAGLKKTGNDGDVIIYNLFVSILDKNLNIIDKKEYEADGDFYFMGVEPVGGFLAMLHDGDNIIISTHLFGGELEDTKPVMFRFDENGNMLSSSYPVPGDGLYDNIYIDLRFEIEIEKRPDSNGYILLAKETSQGLKLIQYDNDLNYQGWSEVLHPEYEEVTPSCLYNKRVSSDLWIDNNRMLMYGNRNYRQSDGDELIRYDVILSYIDIDGNVDRHEVILGSDSCFMVTGGNNCMEYVNDSTIYGTYLAFDKTGTQRYIPGVCLFSHNMELLGRYELKDEKYNYLTGFILTYDNGDCLYVSDSWTFNPNGCIMRISREDFNPSYVSVKEVPTKEIESLVYPNPTEGELNIDIRGIGSDNENRIRITDISGRTMMSRIIRGSGNVLSLDVSMFDAGTYIYEIFNSEGVTARGKFVKK